ncbi:hypothetical protein Hanom_Chr13g01195071 [Helianthus anomalus]
MKDNLRRTGSRTTGMKFWMYPRFMQMIMNAQHPDLPKADTDILKIETINYVAPTSDKWRHDNSQSDDEEPELEKMMKEKLKRKRDSSDSSDSDDDEEGGDGDGGDAGATTASAPGASSAGSDEQADSDYVPSKTETECV